MIIGIKEKSKILTHTMYYIFLVIATNIPLWCMTGFVVQGHKSTSFFFEMVLTAEHKIQGAW